MTSDSAIQLLAARKAELQSRFGVRDVAVFGSVARNEASESSDVDVLVDFNGPATFNGYFDLLFFLEELFGRKVDLVTQYAVRPRIRPYIEKDAIHVP
jgi:predicted nucleotidyltransferase